MNRLLKIISLFFILLLQVNDVASQIKEKATINAWVEAGWLKFAPQRKNSSVGIHLGLKFQRNRLLANLQYHDYIDRDLTNGGFEIFTNNNYYHAGNMMIGITNRQCRVGHVSISSGLGVFWGEFNEPLSDKFVTVGWPVEVAASINIIPLLGINIKVFSNINSKHSLIGFGMDLQLGKMRDFTFKRSIYIESESLPPPNRIYIP